VETLAATFSGRREDLPTRHENVKHTGRILKTIKRPGFRQNEKGTLPLCGRVPSFRLRKWLDYGYIGGGRAFLALLYVEGNPVSFFQGLEAASVDRGMMNEHIRTAILLDEAEALLAIKPLYCSISHSDTLLSKILPCFKLQVATHDKWIYLQKKPARL
jgi:hypothetical protein